MIRVVGVRFKKTGKIYYFDPGAHELACGDQVVVETARGLELGEVAVRPKLVPEDDVVQPLRPVLRRATDTDLRQNEANQGEEQAAFRTGLEKIREHGLGMKLVDVEYTFDRQKLIFYFTAETRVDFRQLVKDLAGTFRTRIELRQIGVRDEAKMLGGIGACGRELCCSTWMSTFEPISIRQAKEQEVALNPDRVLGLCGRLKCCLRYEADTYAELRRELPRVGEVIATSRGPAKVVEVKLLRRRFTVQFEDGDRLELTPEQLKEQTVPAAAAGGGETPGGRERRQGRPAPRQAEGPGRNGASGRGQPAAGGDVQPSRNGRKAAPPTVPHDESAEPQVG